MFNWKTSLLGLALGLGVSVSYAAEQHWLSSTATFKDKETSKKDSTDKKKEDSYKELLKKGTLNKGVFNVLQVEEDIYFEIPDSLLNRQFLIVNYLTQVPLEINDAGANKGINYETKIITFHRDPVAKKIRVKTERIRVSSPQNDAITKSVENNFAPSVLEVFDIEARTPDSTATLIKVNDVFNGKRKSFNDVLSGLSLPTSLDTKLSYIDTVKTFDKNVIVKSLMTTKVDEGGGDMAITLGVATNLVLLDTTPMQPRVADDRVGYFTVPHWFFSDDQQKMKREEFITRWKLEPKPEDVEAYLNGELVEPQQPIVFYIDPATPPQWRQKIIAGVKDWQVAFEAAGFKNAIVAKLASEAGDDFDIDDVRYSVITYAASAKSNAMGPSVVDPRSGEIISSKIIWWHNVMTSLHSWMRIQTGAIDPKARANKFSDEHMGEAIRFVSSHEVGHTLGLQHNMGASFAFPVDSLRSKTYTDKMGGTAPSIMDYARYNYVAQPGDGVTAITPKIGMYDKYAINWGYRWYADKTVEKKALRQLIKQHEGDPMYFFGAQQSFKNIVDPRSQSEDLGNNAMKASEYGLKNLKIVVDSIIPWTYEEDQDFYEAGKLYMGSIGQWQMYNLHVMANIGGIYLDHARYGNGFKAHTPVPYAVQNEAVDYLIKHVVHLPKWLFFDEVNLKTYPVKDSPLGPYEHSPYALARELQYSIIYYTLMDERLLRLLDAEVMANQQIDQYPDQVFTVNDLFTKLRTAIFEPTQKRQDLSILERMAEKNYVDALIIDVNKLFKKTRRSGLMLTQSLQMPELCQVEAKQLQYIDFDAMKRVSEVTTYKKTELMRIKKLVEKRKNTGDEATQAHYLDLINRINEALGI